MEEKRTKEIEEAVIEPELRICDAHHHLWDIAGNRYMTQDFLRDIGGQRVVKTVCVETWARAQRSGWLKEPAEQTAFAVADSAKNRGDTQVAAGIVGYADLMEGDGVARVIEAHFAAGRGRFRGIRLPPGSMFNDVKFVEGFRHIVKYNLTVDAIVHGQQLLELKALANRYPEVPIVINHLGLVTLGHPPGHSHATDGVDENVRSWKIMVDSMGECPNLFMKLGGLGMDMAGAGWNKPTKPDSVELAAIMKPWFTYCIEKFGPERCMFESNFPVDKRSFSYTVYWNAAKRFSKAYSRSERDALFFGTAAKVYRLE